MAVSAYERQAMLLRLEVKSPEGAPLWTPSAFFSAIQKLYNEQGGSLEVSEGMALETEEDEAEDADGEVVVGPVLNSMDDPAETAAAMKAPPGVAVSKDGLMRIVAMRTGSDGTVTILLAHGDRRASDPAHMHLETGEITTTAKGDKHGLAHGAHLVIETGTGDAKPVSARALLERSPNLGRSSIVVFLNSLMRRISRHNKLQYLDPTEGKLYRYNPKLSATQPLSASMEKDIKAGRIGGLTLTQRKPKETGLDVEGVMPQVQTLRCTVDPAYPRTNNLKLIEKIREFGVAKGYNDLEVSLRGSKGHKAMSPRFAMDYADAQDVIYARMEPIQGFKDRLVQCPEEIVEPIVVKMQAMLNRPDLWK